ncbi:hypothetical protein F4779DRAFT_602764 [Xylariaceae sp. FL0662B]|nr:hypothetical protein F4779DRAFT_602764 [Xylariaceae sp. FL0662B]
MIEASGEYIAVRESISQEDLHEILKNIISSLRVLIEFNATETGLRDLTGKLIEDSLFAFIRSPFDSVKICQLLLQCEVLDVHQRNCWGQTVLNQIMSRCFEGKMLDEPLRKPNLVRFLARNGADLDSCDDEGFTPLHYAILYGDVESVELLLELGANPTKRVNGSTPTHYAFGKPFVPRGPIMRKIMGRLRVQYNRLIIDGTDSRRGYKRRLKPKLDGKDSWFNKYVKGDYEKSRRNFVTRVGKRGWHPLSTCAAPALKMQTDIEWPGDESSSDEWSDVESFGDESSGDINPSTMSLDARNRMWHITILLHAHENDSMDENGMTPRQIAESLGLFKHDEPVSLEEAKQRHSDIAGRTFNYYNHMLYKTWLHWRENGKCPQICQICYTFPPPLLDRAISDK